LAVQLKGGTTIIRTKPQPGDQPPSEAQQAVRGRFQEAVAYAKGAKEKPAYVGKAAGTEKSAYNVAAADWLHPPEVVEVDPSTGSGQAWRLGRAASVRSCGRRCGMT